MLEPSSAPRHQLFGGLGADIFGALFRQIPKLFGIFQADARDQVLQRQTIARHHRTEQAARGAPADMAAFQHNDAGAEACRLQRHRQAGKPRADHANVGIEVESQPCAGGVADAGIAREDIAHAVFLRTRPVLVTLSLAATQ